MTATDKRNDRNWHTKDDPMNAGPGVHDDTSAHGPSSEYGANFRDQDRARDTAPGYRYGNLESVSESRYGNGSERYGNEARYATDVAAEDEVASAKRDDSDASRSREGAEAREPAIKHRTNID